MSDTWNPMVLLCVNAMSTFLQCCLVAYHQLFFVLVSRKLHTVITFSSRVCLIYHLHHQKYLANIYEIFLFILEFKHYNFSIFLNSPRSIQSYQALGAYLSSYNVFFINLVVQLLNLCWIILLHIYLSILILLHMDILLSLHMRIYHSLHLDNLLPLHLIILDLSNMLPSAMLIPMYPYLPYRFSLSKKTL